MDEHAAAIMKMLRAGGPKIIRYEKARRRRAAEPSSRRSPFLSRAARGAAAVDLPPGGRGLGAETAKRQEPQKEPEPKAPPLRMRSSAPCQASNVKPDLDPLIDKDNKAAESGERGGVEPKECRRLAATPFLRTRSSSRESPPAGKSTRRAKAGAAVG